MKQVELWLIRHGITDWNIERRMQGNSDILLNELGLRQAEALAKRIGHERFDVIYSSDLLRARKTAEIVFPGQAIKLDKRLREIHLGDYEGKIAEELTEDHVGRLRVWWKGPYHQRVPGGESSDDMQARVRSWLADLPKSGRVIAFSHGGTIGSILQIFTGRAASRLWRFDFANTSISRLLITDDLVRLQSVNDAAHLDSLDLEA